MADEPQNQPAVDNVTPPTGTPVGPHDRKPVSRTALLISLGALIAFVALGSIFAARFILGGPEDTWVCVDGAWVKHGNPVASAPTTGCEPTAIGPTKTSTTPTPPKELGPVTDTPDADKRSTGEDVSRLVATTLEKCPGLGISPITTSTAIVIPPKDLPDIIKIMGVADVMARSWLAAYKKSTACDAGRLLDFKWSVVYNGVRGEDIAAMLIFSVKPSAGEKSAWLEPASGEKIDKKGWIMDKNYVLLIGRTNDIYQIKNVSLTTTALPQ